MKKTVKDLFEERIKLILSLKKDDQIQALIDFKKKAICNIDAHILNLRKKQNLIREAIRQKKYLKQYKESLWYFVAHAKIRHILSLPFIYFMIFPAIIFHICLELYHRICFFLYRIPFVNCRRFFVFDRGKLSYLNILV